MGGERERAVLAAFEALLSKCIAEALVAQLRKEAEAHGVDVVTWLMREQEHRRRGTLRAWGSPSRSNLHRNEVDFGVKAAGNAARAQPPLACR